MQAEKAGAVKSWFCRKTCPDVSKLIVSRSDNNAVACLSDNGTNGGLVKAQLGRFVNRAVIALSAGIMG